MRTLRVAAAAPTDFTLPPALYAKAVALAHTEYIVYFGYYAATLIVLWLMLRLGFAARLRNFAERHTRHLLLQASIVTPPVLLVIAVANLPWLILAHRVSLESGLSIEPWVPWLWDWAKEQMVTIVVGALLAALFFAIVRWSPRRYWLWFWAASLPLMAAAVFLAPLLLDPLFNRFEPLAKTHPELVAPIEQILHKTGVAVPRDRLYEMIASDKTNALNAYVTGFGSSKRVVLYDTIIRKEPVPELMTTFAHELGHYALHHIPIGLLFSAVLLFALMYAGYRIVAAALLRPALATLARGPGDLAALPLFLFLAVAASFLCDPLVNAFSRYQEHAADVFSLEATSGVIPDPGAAAARAFQIEGETDLELPDPHPAAVFWMYTHPPVRDRLRFALGWQPAVTPLRPRAEVPGGLLQSSFRMQAMEEQHRQEIIRLGKLMYQKGWVAANDGNLTVRLDSDRVLCTPTGVCKGMMQPDDLCICDMDGNTLEGNRARTSEIAMHLTVYRMRPDINSVVHAHPPVATGFAVAGKPLNLALLPEVIIGLGAVPLAGYGLPGTPELTRDMLQYIPKYDAVLMGNHGVVAWGANINKAFWNLETVEHFAHITFVAEMLGGARALPRRDVERLFDSRNRYGVVSNANFEPGSPLVKEDQPQPAPRAITREELLEIIDEALRARGVLA